MKFKELDCVVLTRDIPEHALKTGDLGTVVEIYGDEGLEVEFIKTSGDTQALLTLSVADVRAGEPDDLLAVRSLSKAG